MAQVQRVSCFVSGFCKAPSNTGSLAIDEARNPAINESEEAELRKDIEGLAGLDQRQQQRGSRRWKVNMASGGRGFGRALD